MWPPEISRRSSAVLADRWRVKSGNHPTSDKEIVLPPNYTTMPEKFQIYPINKVITPWLVALVSGRYLCCPETLTVRNCMVFNLKFLFNQLRENKTQGRVPESTFSRALVQEVPVHTHSARAHRHMLANKARTCWVLQLLRFRQQGRDWRLFRWRECYSLGGSSCPLFE